MSTKSSISALLIILTKIIGRASTVVVRNTFKNEDIKRLKDGKKRYSKFMEYYEIIMKAGLEDHGKCVLSNTRWGKQTITGVSVIIHVEIYVPMDEHWSVKANKHETAGWWFFPVISMMGLPGGANGKESTYQCRRQTWVQTLGGEDPLEGEMAAHSSILAWRIPRTEEPGRLQSMGSERVRHDWASEHISMMC